MKTVDTKAVEEILSLFPELTIECAANCPKARASDFKGKKRN